MKVPMFWYKFRGRNLIHMKSDSCCGFGQLNDEKWNNFMLCLVYDKVLEHQVAR